MTEVHAVRVLHEEKWTVGLRFLVKFRRRSTRFCKHLLRRNQFVMKLYEERNLLSMMQLLTSLSSFGSAQAHKLWLRVKLSYSNGL